MNPIQYGVYANVDGTRFVHFASGELPATMGANAALVSTHATMAAALLAAALSGPTTDAATEPKP